MNKDRIVGVVVFGGLALALFIYVFIRGGSTGLAQGAGGFFIGLAIFAAIFGFSFVTNRLRGRL